jgi:hypothetical protein
MWHKQIPSTVSIFAWHLLRDRLPTKENLVACGILSSEAHFCVSGCGSIETAQHLFLLAVRLGPCGHLFAIGLAFQRLMPLLSVIIWFSSHSQLEVHELVGRFCSLFGLHAFGSRGTNEIIVCSTMQQVSCIWYWTKSRCSLFDGWRRRMLLLLHIIILCGQTHCSAWAFTNNLCILTLLIYWYLCKLSGSYLTHLVLRILPDSFIYIYIYMYIFHFTLFKSFFFVANIWLSK